MSWEHLVSREDTRWKRCAFKIDRSRAQVKESPSSICFCKERCQQIAQLLRQAAWLTIQGNNAGLDAPVYQQDLAGIDFLYCADAHARKSRQTCSYCECIVYARRPKITHLDLTDGPGRGILCLQLGHAFDPSQPEKFCARALHIAEVIGVVDHARQIGVLVVDP